MSKVEGEGTVWRGSGEANVVEMLWKRIALEWRERKVGGGERRSKRGVERVCRKVVTGYLDKRRRWRRKMFGWEKLSAQRRSEELDTERIPRRVSNADVQTPSHLGSVCSSSAVMPAARDVFSI